MDKAIDIILQHKDMFRQYYPIPVFDELLVLRGKESIPPTAEGMRRLTDETMDLVVSHSELPQYLAFMDLFYTDVLARLSSDIKQKFISMTKYFLLPFPRGSYSRISKKDPTSENNALLERYKKEFDQAGLALNGFTFSGHDVEDWIGTMMRTHQGYKQSVDEATPYYRTIIKEYMGRGKVADFVAAIDDGSIDKERYNRELLVAHRYHKSVPYFMHDSDVHGAYGPDFVGPFGIFYPISEKYRELPMDLRKSLDER